MEYCEWCGEEVERGQDCEKCYMKELPPSVAEFSCYVPDLAEDHAYIWT